MRKQWNRIAVFGLGTTLVVFGGMACGDDDDDNGIDIGNGTPDAVDDTPANGTPAGETPSNGTPDVTDEVEEQFQALEDEWNNASDETQEQLDGIWTQVQEAYEEWQNASDSEREAVADAFATLAENLEQQLQELSE